MKINVRTFRFFKTDISLTSKRVSVILSNSIDSDELAKSVRRNRLNPVKKASFTITKETKKILDEELASV